MPNVSQGRPAGAVPRAGRVSTLASSGCPAAARPGPGGRGARGGGRRPRGGGSGGSSAEPGPAAPSGRNGGSTPVWRPGELRLPARTDRHPGPGAPASGRPRAPRRSQPAGAGALPSAGCAAGPRDAALRRLLCPECPHTSPARLGISPAISCALPAEVTETTKEMLKNKLENTLQEWHNRSGHPRTSSAVPVPFCESPAPGSFSNHFPQGREVPS